MTNALLSTRRTWAAMINRCLSKNDPRYADYGGRGITVCDRWLDFNTFLEDMGTRPSKELQLDRIDNNKGYHKLNCRWATSAENNSNKRLYEKAINNKSGVTGVSQTARGYWRAYGGRELLYVGKSYEEACKERFLWETECKQKVINA